MPESLPWASFLPILRCPGLPYTKYGCAGASRLGKKIQPKARRSFPILRCGGLPYRKYGCAAAPRLGEKSIAKRCVSANTSLPRLAVHKVRLCRGVSSWQKNPAQGTALVPHTSLRRLAIQKVWLCRCSSSWRKIHRKEVCVRQYFVAPACRTQSTAVLGRRPVFTGRFSVAILPEVWYNRTNVGRQVCLCGYWASIPASPLWASG